MTKQLQDALQALNKAVTDEGTHPEHHKRVLWETEQRWPSLMAAVRAVLAAQT